jgi:hypothetical protein
MSKSSENDESDRSRCSPEFILGGASGGNGLARRGAEGREDGRNWFLAVAAGEAAAGIFESVGRGGGGGRELAVAIGARCHHRPTTSNVEEKNTILKIAHLTL